MGGCDLQLQNFIEIQYKELAEHGSINDKFIELYADCENTRLREILSTLHYNFVSLFRQMNEHLPTDDNGARFLAESSRNLIQTIDMTLLLYRELRNTYLAIEIDQYYLGLIEKCRGFLRRNYGSQIPPNMDEIKLYYLKPIFLLGNNVVVSRGEGPTYFKLTHIGEGSYANVFSYKDTFYNRFVVIKRAKKDLTSKELERFRLEYREMEKLSSPYIPEVYRLDEAKNEYFMEYMDFTLKDLMERDNSTLSFNMRKNLINQILRAFEYIHSNDRLHRDISPTNILIKDYHDTPVIKVADFGLVKIPGSSLTSVNTEFKGSFNDPSLLEEGFINYDMDHETYALTRIISYVMTGRTNVRNIKDPELDKFVKKGVNVNRAVRFKTVKEMARAFKDLTSDAE